MTSISIIIPAYNMAEFIGDAIASVLAGEFMDFELIVVDDGSEDGTGEAVRAALERAPSESAARVRYYARPNRGKAAAVNFGLRESRGEYITILDADDELSRDSLAARWAAVEESPNGRPDMVVGAFEVYDGDRVLGRRVPPAGRTADALRRMIYLSYKTPFHLNACLIRRDVLERLDGLDERLRRCEDWDLSMRLTGECEEVTVIPDVVYRYRKHRGDVRTRLRYRWKTATEKPVILWRNCNPAHSLMVIPLTLALELAKGAYEVFGNYGH